MINLYANTNIKGKSRGMLYVTSMTRHIYTKTESLIIGSLMARSYKLPQPDETIRGNQELKPGGETNIIFII